MRQINHSNPDALLVRYLHTSSEDEAKGHLEEFDRYLRETIRSTVNRRMRFWRLYLHSVHPADANKQARQEKERVYEFAQILVRNAVLELKSQREPSLPYKVDYYVKGLCSYAVTEYQKEHYSTVHQIQQQLEASLASSKNFNLWRRYDSDWVCSFNVQPKSGRFSTSSERLQQLFSDPPLVIRNYLKQHDYLGGIKWLLHEVGHPLEVDGVTLLMAKIVEMSRPENLPHVEQKRETEENSASGSVVRWVVNPTPVRKTQLQKFIGYMERFDGDSAFATLRDGDGHLVDAEFAADRLQAQGIAEGDTFAYTLYDVDGDLTARFEPTPFTQPADAEWEQTRGEIDRLIGDYSFSHV